MEIGKASKTALRVAIRRAAHQLIDRPPVLADPIAVRLADDGSPRDMERAQHRVARDFRAYLAARSRYVEERLAVVVAGGVEQYVVLGAGLETFAYRNPFPALRVFEVDLPATQAWKRHLLAKAGIDLPANLTFVPLDLERQTLVDGLVEAGFDRRRPAFFGWLGVVPYLTLEAFRATLDALTTCLCRRRSARSAARYSTGCRSAWLPPESLSGSFFRRKSWRRSFTAPAFSASKWWIQTGSTNATSRIALTASSYRGQG
jgi:methyltransferase (TIGR00027 family)